ncbi:tetratricopeptide repeat protein [Mucilaginibacter sp.]|uniref:tetratricopeptide repeat protein n=1 Tax=Mucilaginibacter sp. TaxID=1882438 RepID=UPI002C7B7470|nr:SH3 domain-containing protein [Mucilaginibacter sp.]HTI58615.1 SH3 domain-containing protein [Mucilaginibacter sp.]
MRFKRSLKILLLFGWFLLPLFCFGDSQAGERFLQANALYGKGQYSAAAKEYKKLMDDGYASAALYFNAGNASYKNGDIASAILYYEKARKLSPGDDDINFNLKYANLKTVDKVDAAPEFFLTRWWKGLILSLSLKTLSMLSIILVLAGSAALILYFFAEAVNIKKAAFYLAVALYICGLCAVFIAGSQSGYFADHRQAIVFTSTVNVKSGPAERASTLFVLHDGTKVDILDDNNGWVKIRLANGNEGWIQQPDIKEM